MKGREKDNVVAVENGKIAHVTLVDDLASLDVYLITCSCLKKNMTK